MPCKETNVKKHAHRILEECFELPRSTRNVCLAVRSLRVMLLIAFCLAYCWSRPGVAVASEPVRKHYAGHYSFSLPQDFKLESTELSIVPSDYPEGVIRVYETPWQSENDEEREKAFHEAYQAARALKDKLTGDMLAEAGIKYLFLENMDAREVLGQRGVIIAYNDLNNFIVESFIYLPQGFLHVVEPYASHDHYKASGSIPLAAGFLRHYHWGRPVPGVRDVFHTICGYVLDYPAKSRAMSARFSSARTSEIKIEIYPPGPAYTRSFDEIARLEEELTGVRVIKLRERNGERGHVPFYEVVYSDPEENTATFLLISHNGTATAAASPPLEIKAQCRLADVDAATQIWDAIVNSVEQIDS